MRGEHKVVGRRFAGFGEDWQRFQEEAENERCSKLSYKKVPFLIKVGLTGWKRISISMGLFVGKRSRVKGYCRTVSSDSFLHHRNDRGKNNVSSFGFKMTY